MSATVAMIGEAMSSSSAQTSLSVASTAAQAAVTIQQGREQDALYKAQAGQARLQSRGEAVKYERQANAIVKRMLETQAMARARAAAGGVDPFSGSAAFVNAISGVEAGEEIDLSRENARLVALAGEQQADIYRRAGRSARNRGLLAGFTTIGLGAGRAGTVGGPPARSGQFSLTNRQYG